MQGVLDRGFAILRDPRGRPLTDATTLVVGARVQAQLARGSADLLVEGTRPNDL
ncbi:hypothetical protein SBBP2_440014 [Burkholderiales bacterium]|nr:hypothetical protein SBBP2_440014 [Burkholderiales bacterium]